MGTKAISNHRGRRAPLSNSVPVRAPLASGRQGGTAWNKDDDREWRRGASRRDSVTVVPPHDGRDYEVVRGEAAIAGVRYEIADGNEILNLGEKLMLVMTREGTWRGLQAEVADIARALQSVRSLVRTGHKVVFGD